MNKKIVFENNHGKKVYFILSDTVDLKTQLLETFSISAGHGLTVEMTEKQIEIVDYFHADTVARFEILSILETDQEPCYVLREF